jgi:hypothetical protein
MKFAVLLTAMLSGLCAEAMAAAPIRSVAENINRAIPGRSVIARDTGFSAASDELWSADYNSDADDDVQDLDTADPLSVPEPPPMATIAIGMTFFLTALYHRTWREARIARRRSFQRRAIIAER